MNHITHQKTRRLVTLALLAALIVVLQSLSTFVPGVTPINLTLVPIVIGAILYGPGAGAILGGVFTAVVLIAGFSGSDPFTFALLSGSPIMTVLVCVAKGVGCGAAAGAVYRLWESPSTLTLLLHVVKKNDPDEQTLALCGKIEKRVQRRACVMAAIIAPIVNSGVFTIGMLTVLRAGFESIAASYEIADAVQWLFVGILGVNFLIEFTVNLLLSSAIAYITKAARKR